MPECCRTTGALVVVTALAVVGAFMPGCAAREAENPTELRRNYGNLRNLFRELKWTADALLASLNGEEYDDAVAFAENLQKYATDLPGFGPKGREQIDIERYDHLAERIEALAVAAGNSARLHQNIRGAQDCRQILVLVDEVKAYLGKPGPDEGAYWRERPNPNPIDTPAGPRIP